MWRILSVYCRGYNSGFFLLIVIRNHCWVLLTNKYEECPGGGVCVYPRLGLYNISTYIRNVKRFKVPSKHDLQEDDDEDLDGHSSVGIRINYILLTVQYKTRR